MAKLRRNRDLIYETKANMTKRLSNDAPATLDETDRALLRLLADDARTAVADLAREIGLSAPSTAERLRRLEAQGVVERYTVQVDPRALGYTLQAIVRVKPLPGQLHLVEEEIRRIPEFVECDKVTGDDCFICRLFLRNIEELDEILSKVGERAETSTAIVKATPVARRLPPLGAAEPRTARAASTARAEPVAKRGTLKRGAG
jgi:Lrp/AsnC family leucine-responsive transcriptional regulator